VDDLYDVFPIFFISGYAYAHLLSKSPLKKSAGFHLALLALSLLMFPFSFDSPPRYENAPVWSIGYLLVTTIGLPFILLSTTTILLQTWLASSSLSQSTRPYILYSTSNFGSFAAIFSYPLWIQPTFSLKTQLSVWYSVYFLYSLLHFLCLPQKNSLCSEIEENTISETLAQTARKVALEREKKPGKKQKKKAKVEEKESSPSAVEALRIKPFSRILSFLISTGTCALLLAITNVITIDISPAPILWVFPLAAYLLSFILVFSDHQGIIPLNICLVLGTFFFWGWLQVEERNTFYWLAFFLTLLFTSCCLFHQMLFQVKPSSSEKLSAYYLRIALGGCCGSILINILMPLWMVEVPTIFVDIYVAFVVLFISFLLYHLKYVKLLCGNRWIAILNGVLIIAFVFLILPLNFFRTLPNIKLIRRNFYGILKVVHHKDKKFFWHGSTIHGAQSLLPEEEDLPIYYYRKGAPFEDIIRVKRDAKQVALMGLGAGSLLAYAKPDQHWTIYEIDPDVVEISKNHFSHISHCKASLEFRMGDGRLCLKDSPHKYDIIFMDVFSGDAIPSHMATQEAFEIYVDKLAKDGILVFHCSNRFLNLLPVVTQLSNTFKLYSSFVVLPNTTGEFDQPGVLLQISTPSKELNERFQKEFIYNEKYKWLSTDLLRPVSLWTDERVNFLEVLTIFEKNRPGNVLTFDE
jgi:hypothetical protein